jgi:N-methylhydantoinase B
METAGGGGYGDPAARDPAQVRADVEDGKVSEGGAKAYRGP